MLKWPIIYKTFNKGKTYAEKVSNLKKSLKIQPFVLLARPNKNVYEIESAKKLFIEDLKSIVNVGLLHLEIPWEDNENWLDLMSELRSKFHYIQIGSASLINKKSIKESQKIGLNFSMMRYWEKDLFNYSKKINYLLIPGISKLKDLQEAKHNNCHMIKIFPVANKEKILDIKNYNQISFIGAGGISIKDINKFKKLGYDGIIIGNQGYDGNKLNPEIFKVLRN